MQPRSGTTVEPTPALCRAAELMTTTQEERARMLETARWDAGLMLQQTLPLAKYLRAFRIRAGKTLFNEGDRECYLAIVVSGELHIIKEDSLHGIKLLASLTPGKLVGEMSLVDSGARSATAVAPVETVILVMDKFGFEGLAQALPSLALLLMTRIAQQVSQKLRRTNALLVEHLADTEEHPQKSLTADKIFAKPTGALAAAPTSAATPAKRP